MKTKKNKLIKLSFDCLLDRRSKELRKLVMKGFKNSKKGHIGSSFSMMEILRVLYDDILNYNSKNPEWNLRDRLIVSPGWASLGLYAILADKGFINKNKLNQFMNTKSILGGCIEKIVPGVEATTGSCGHGLSIAAGIALSLKLKKKKQKVFVIVGDGEHGEGSVWEGALSISRHRLDNLIIIVDYNKVQCSGLTKNITSLEPLAKKWESFGMIVNEVNGHDIVQLKNKFNKLSFDQGKANVIICHTVMSKGIKIFENNANYHWKGKIDNNLYLQMVKSINEY